MSFILLVAFSAFFVAGCAAFFSIKGLIVLFSGDALAIGVMASSLELGKLVAASFLHSYWKTVSKLLKLYLCLAVFVLMCVTSLGIFGFLTGAYQEHSTRVNTFDTKIAALTLEKSSVDQAVLERTDRIKSLADLRQTQEQRIQTAGNLKGPREQAYKSIAEANEEIQKKELEVSSARQRAVELDKEISELKITLDTTTDIGSFKFLASALHTDVDTAVRYFIFALIFVFDPLAVTLVLALNKLIEVRAARKDKELEQYEASLRSLHKEESLTATNKNFSETLGVFIDEDDFEPVTAETKKYVTPEAPLKEEATPALDIAGPLQVNEEIQPGPPMISIEPEHNNPIAVYEGDPVSDMPISEVEMIPLSRRARRVKASSQPEQNTADVSTWQRVIK
jgi:NADH:ubiquinone oxidoreductase subunit 3 (subunit A)